MIGEYETETQSLLSKVAVAQSNKRFKDQVGRDESNAIGAVSIYEYEELQKEKQVIQDQYSKLEADYREKELSCSTLASELKTAEFELQTSQDMRSKLQKANHEMSKKESHFAERLAEAVQKEGQKSLRLENELEKVVGELTVKQRELDTSKDEISRLRAEAEKFSHEMQRVKGEVNSAMQAAEAANENSAKFQSRIKEMEADLHAAKKKLSRKDNEPEMSESPREIKSSRNNAQKYAELSAALAAAEAAKEAEQMAQKRIVELESELNKVKNLTVQSNKPSSTANILTEATPASHKENESSHARDDRHTAMIDSLKDTISSLKTDLRDLPNRLRAEYDEKMLAKDEELDKLKMKLIRVESRLPSREERNVSSESNKPASFANTLDEISKSSPIKNDKPVVESPRHIPPALSPESSPPVTPKLSQTPATTILLVEKETKSSSCQTEPLHITSPTEMPSNRDVTAVGIQTEPVVVASKINSEENSTLHLTRERSPRLTNVPDNSVKYSQSKALPTSLPDNSSDIVDASAKATPDVIVASNETYKDNVINSAEYNTVNEEHRSLSDINPVYQSNGTNGSIVTSNENKPRIMDSLSEESVSARISTPPSYLVHNEVHPDEDTKIRHVLKANPVVLSSEGSPPPNNISILDHSDSKMMSVDCPSPNHVSPPEVENVTALSQHVLTSSKDMVDDQSDCEVANYPTMTGKDVARVVDAALQDHILSNSRIMKVISDKESFARDLSTMFCGYYFVDGKCTFSQRSRADFQHEVNELVSVLRCSLSKFMKYENTTSTTNKPSSIPTSVTESKSEIETPTESLENLNARLTRDLKSLQEELEEMEEAKRAVQINLNYRDQQLQEAKNSIKALKKSESKWKDKLNEALDKIHKLMTVHAAEKKAAAGFQTKKGEPNSFAGIVSLKAKSHSESREENNSPPVLQKKKREMSHNLNFLKTVAKVQAASKKLRHGHASMLLDNVRSQSISIVRSETEEKKEAPMHSDIAIEESNDTMLEADKDAFEKAALLRERRNFLRKVKEDLANMGEVRSNSFEKLMIGKYGGDDIVFLTRFQYSIDNIETNSSKTVNTRDTFNMNSVSVMRIAGSVSGPDLQKRAAILEMEAQRKLVLKKYSIVDFAKFLYETEKDYLLHKSLSTWQKLERMQDEGNFVECLSQHRHTLKQLIDLAGGYKSALRDIKIHRNLMIDTSYWEDHFRIKILEYCREELTASITEGNRIQDVLRNKIKETVEKLESTKREAHALRMWSVHQISTLSKQLRDRIQSPLVDNTGDFPSSDNDKFHEFSLPAVDNCLIAQVTEEVQESISDLFVPEMAYGVTNPFENIQTHEEVDEGYCLIPSPEVKKVVESDSTAHFPEKVSKYVQVNFPVPSESSRENEEDEETKFDARGEIENEINSLQLRDEVQLHSGKENASDSLESNCEPRVSNSANTNFFDLNDSDDEASCSLALSSPDGDMVRKDAENSEKHNNKGYNRPFSKDKSVILKVPTAESIVESKQSLPNEGDRSLSPLRQTTSRNIPRNPKKISDGKKNSSRSSSRGRERSRNTSRSRPLSKHRPAATDSSPLRSRNTSASSGTRTDRINTGHVDVKGDISTQNTARSRPSSEQRLSSSPCRTSYTIDFDRDASTRSADSTSSGTLSLRLSAELYELAISLFRGNKNSFSLVEQLVPVLAEFSSREKRLSGLARCMTLCRRGMSDEACILGLLELAENENSHVASCQIEHHRLVLEDALRHCADCAVDGHAIKNVIEEDKQVVDNGKELSKLNVTSGTQRGSSNENFYDTTDDDNHSRKGNLLSEGSVSMDLKDSFNDFLEVGTSRSTKNAVGDVSSKRAMESRHSQTDDIFSDDMLPLCQNTCDVDPNSFSNDIARSSSLQEKENDGDPGDILLYVQIRQAECDIVAETVGQESKDINACDDDSSMNSGMGSPMSGQFSLDSPLRSPTTKDDLFLEDAANKRNCAIIRSDKNAGVELSPGIRMLSNAVTVFDKATGKEKTWKLPSNVVLVKKRKKSTQLFKGIVAWNKWYELDIEEPVFPPNVLAVEIPSILYLNNDVHLLCDCSLPFNLEVPQDTWVVALRRESTHATVEDLYPLLPRELVPVKLSPVVTVSSDLMERLEPHKFLVEAIPHDVMRIQNRYASLPVGFIFSPGVTLAEARCLPPKKVSNESNIVSTDDDSEKSDEEVNLKDEKKVEEKSSEQKVINEEDIEYVPLKLPPGILLVNVESGSKLPSYLRFLKLEDSSAQVGIEEERQECRLEAESIMYQQSVSVLKCPEGVKLLPGMLIIKRALSLHGKPLPLPPTMKLCPPNLIPEELKIRKHVEVVQLRPYFSFPDKMKLCKGVEIFQTPPGMHLECDMVLIRRYAGAALPQYCRPAVIPHCSDDIYIPADVEAMYLPHGSRLPVGAEIMPNAVVVAVPNFDSSKLLPGVLFVHRQGREEDKNRPLPGGFMPAPLRLLPHDCFLPPDVEVVCIRAQYVLPAGVTMSPGASLSKDVQLPPGLEIFPNVEVVKWPYGVYLPSNIECVKKVNNKMTLPPEINIIDDSIEEVSCDKFAINVTPSKCYFVRLPRTVILPCAAELTEQCMLAPLHRQSFDNELIPNDIVAIKRVRPTVFNTKQPLNQKQYAILPPQFVQQPRNILPPEVEKSLPQDIILVKVHSHYAIPTGAEIGPDMRAESHVNAPSIPHELVVVKSDSEIVENSEVQRYPAAGGYSCDEYCSVWYSGNLHCITSWGTGYDKFRPIFYPNLPQGYFLVNQPRNVEDEFELPTFLEFVKVEDEHAVCAGLRLPPGTRLIRLLPVYWLPFGIAADTFDALPASSAIQFCPGDVTGTHDREFCLQPVQRLDNKDKGPQRRFNTLISSRMMALLAAKPSTKVKVDVPESFNEDSFLLTESFLSSLSERIIEQLIVKRMRTLDRGKNYGYINATLQPPSEEVTDTSALEKSLRSRKPDRQDRPHSQPAGQQLQALRKQFPREIKAKRPLSRQLTRSISKILKQHDNIDHSANEKLLEASKRDLEKAMRKLENTEEELEESLKKNRQLSRDNDARMREIESMQLKMERMSAHTAGLQDEVHAAHDARNKAQAELAKESTFAVGTIASLTAEKRNLTFIVAEKDDTIQALQEKIQFMNENNGVSKLQAAENMRKQQVAVNEAVAEYRKLLKIGASSAFQAVRAVRDYCYEDNQTFSNMKIPHIFTQGNFGDDDLSVLTDDNENNSLTFDDMSLNSLDKLSTEESQPVLSTSMSLSELPSRRNESFLPDVHDGLSTPSQSFAPTSSSVSMKKKSMSARGSKNVVGRKQKTTIDTMKQDKKNQAPNAGEIVIDESHLYSLFAVGKKPDIDHSKSKSRRKGQRTKTTCDLSVSTIQNSVEASKTNMKKPRHTSSLAGLDLLDARVRNPGPYEVVNLAPIDIDTYLELLDSAFVFEEVVVDTSNMSARDIEIHKFVKQGKYVLNKEKAEEIAADWLRKATDILTACLASSLKTYASSVVLLEKEICCHMNDKKRMENRIEHLEDKYKDAVSKTETAPEALLSFKLEELRQQLEKSTAHLHNMRKMSSEPLLQVLSEQSKLIQDLERQEMRLRMCAEAISRKAEDELKRARRAPIDDDKERLAHTQFVNWLKKRTQEVHMRADAIQVHIKEAASSVRQEFENFEGKVQNVLPGSIMMKVLSYGAVRTNRNSVDDGKMNMKSLNDSKLLESSGFLSDKKELNGEKGGRVLTVDDFKDDNNGNADSTKQLPLLPFTRESTFLTKEEATKGAQQNSARLSSRRGSRDGKESPKVSVRSLRDVKADPFNRSFTDL